MPPSPSTYPNPSPPPASNSFASFRKLPWLLHPVALPTPNPAGLSAALKLRSVTLCLHLTPPPRSTALCMSHRAAELERAQHLMNPLTVQRGKLEVQRQGGIPSQQRGRAGAHSSLNCWRSSEYTGSCLEKLPVMECSPQTPQIPFQCLGYFLQNSFM